MTREEVILWMSTFMGVLAGAVITEFAGIYPALAMVLGGVGGVLAVGRRRSGDEEP